MKKLKNQISFLILFIYLIFILLFPPNVINYPKLILINTIRYPLQFFNGICYNILFLVRSKGLVKDNARLYKELNIAQAKLSELAEIKSENERLKNILAFKEKSKLKFIACPIISKDSTNISNSLIVGSGKISGVDVGTVVLTEAGVVGRVVEASANTSRVLLITDFNSRISVIGLRTRVGGMLHGASSGFCTMKYLPLDADIEVGDLIVTSSFSRHFPKGLIIGKVIKIEEDYEGLSLHAIIKPGFDLSRIEEVLCIKK